MTIVSLAAGVAVWWITRPQLVNHPMDVWIDHRDQERFAGMWVAVDSDTNELVAAATNREIVEDDLRLYHPERRCDIVSVPGVASEPLKVLLGVGPCKPDDDRDEYDWMGRSV